MSGAGFIKGLPVRRCPKHGEFPEYDGSTGYPLVSCRECDSYSEDDRPGGFVASSVYSVAEAVAEWNDYVDGEISEEDEARAAGMVELDRLANEAGEMARADPVMNARNNFPGVDDTRTNSASPCSPLHSLTAPQPGEEDNRNRTPSVTGSVPVLLRGFSDQGVTRGAGGQAAPSGLRPCGDNSRDILRLDMLVRTLRETLQVARGQVLTDQVIEERSRNGAQAIDYAIAAFDDDETLPA